MPYKRFSFAHLLSLIALISVTLSCSLVMPTAAPSTSQPTPTSKTAQAIIADKIDIDYLYRSELITVIYPLYGSTLDDFAIYTITNHNKVPVTLVVSSEITGYTDSSIDTVEISPDETLEIRQNPRLIPEKIEQLNSAKLASFHFNIQYLENGEKMTLAEETAETVVYARRDFPWDIEGFTSPEVFDLIAAMVTPNDPAVEEWIRSAAEYMPDGTMWSGYGGHENDDNGGVYQRLEALWQSAANDYQLTYISTMISYAPGEVQRIRLPAEVLSEHSGNCIELALLFTSAAEALGLEAAMIRIPGHAYMAVRMDEVHANYYVIEATMIGGSSFAESINRGSEELDEALPHIEAGDQWWDWITINEAREKGILPLPWR